MTKESTAKPDMTINAPARAIAQPLWAVMASNPNNCYLHHFKI
jgi:hypothetical protein